MAYRSLTERAMRVAPVAAVAGFVASLLLTVFVPVYTDEIGWRFQERAGFDGVDKLFSDICGPNTLARPPFFMVPARYYSALFNSAFAGPAWVRASGVLYALLIVGLLIAVIARLSANRREQGLLTAFGIGLLGVGMLPMLLAWSRPEQPVVMALLGAVLLGLPRHGAAGAARPVPMAWLRAGGILALWVVAVSYHLKGLFLLPAFLAALWYCAAGPRTQLPRIAAAVVLLAVTAFAAHYWLARMSCPDSPILRNAFAQNSIGGDLAAVRSFDDAMRVGRMMLDNVTLLGYVVHTVPNVKPLSYWLPANQISIANSFSFYAGVVVLWLMALLTTFAALRSAIVVAWRERRVERRTVFALALIVTIVGWSASQGWRNVYEIPFVITLAVLAQLLLLAGSDLTTGKNRVVQAIAALFAVLCLINPVVLGTIWGPALARSWDDRGYIADQPYSIALRGYPALRERIMATAKMCRIPEPAKAQGVLVDELTYFAYMDSRLPQHRLGVLSVWNGEIDDPIAYLRSRKSDGAIVGCHLLKGELRQRARANGQFCCLGPADIGG